MRFNQLPNRSTVLDRNARLAMTVTFLFFVVGNAAIAQNGGTGYQSVWASLYPATLTPTTNGTGQPIRLSPVFRDFYAAAASKRLETASKRWKSFAEKHDPGDGDFEDAVQEKFWKWAKLELQRCNHLQANDLAAAAKVEKALKIMGADQG